MNTIAKRAATARWDASTHMQKESSPSKIASLLMRAMSKGLLKHPKPRQTIPKSRTTGDIVSKILRSSPKSLSQGKIKPVMPSKGGTSGGFLTPGGKQLSHTGGKNPYRAKDWTPGAGKKFTAGLDDMGAAAPLALGGAAVAGGVGAKGIEALSADDPDIAAPEKGKDSVTTGGTDSTESADRSDRRDKALQMQDTIRPDVEVGGYTSNTLINDDIDLKDRIHKDVGSAAGAYDKPIAQTVGGVAGAGLGYLGSKAVGKLTGNKSALRDILSGGVGAGVGVAAGNQYHKMAAYTDGYMVKGAGWLDDAKDTVSNTGKALDTLGNSIGAGINNAAATHAYNTRGAEIDANAPGLINRAVDEGGNLGLPVGAGIGALTGFGASSMYGALTDNKSKLRDVLLAGSGLLVGGGVGRAGGRAAGALGAKDIIDSQRLMNTSNYESNII